MLDFEYAVSTKVVFGKNKVSCLGEEISRYHDKILFVYGGGSIKKTGLYDTVIAQLKDHNITYHELSGVKPNPTIASVRDGMKLCRAHDLGFVLAVGGGSAIDCAKTIAAGMCREGDPWELFMQGDSKIKEALPVGTVLTLAGTGSEMNGNAVITNEDTHQKLAIHRDVLRPRFSILDPALTFTVPRKHTVAGTVDIFSHILEQYFSPSKDAFVQDRLAEALMRTVLHYSHIVVDEPRNYEARASLMWTSSLALNGLLGYGKITDWATHGIEHAVSAYYDVTHGVGLAILTPVWMEYVLCPENRWKFVEYASHVWGVTEKNSKSPAEEGIKKTQNFFKGLGMPTRLRDVGVQQDCLEEMARSVVACGPVGKLVKLNQNDVFTILKNAF